MATLTSPGVTYGASSVGLCREKCRVLIPPLETATKSRIRLVLETVLLVT